MDARRGRTDELFAALFPAWDVAYAAELRQAFGLDGHARISTLSKGQKARVGLLAALAHRPEPSSSTNRRPD